tara:strand:- start:283 stop:1050 length:768 start_codon:yes stop_codon:yes gene_type:complete
MQQQKQYRVLLIGETCEDSYIFGSVDRISPEAPVPVVMHEATLTTLGMSENVKRNLQAFGVSVTHITNKKLIKKKRIVDSSSKQQLLRIDEDDKVDPIKPAEVKMAFLTSEFDAIVISDYDKGFVKVEDLMTFCQNFTGPVFIDTKKKDLFSAQNVIFKINHKEASTLRVQPAKQNLITTVGGQGAWYMDKLYPSENVDVFDVVGAGDTFLAALCAEFLKEHDMEASIKIANKASAIAVQNYGCHTLTPDDINSL